MILAVRPESDHPQVVSTSRHVTQGMVDLLDEHWDFATKTLRGRSKIVAGDPYEIRVALGAGIAKWRADSAIATSPATTDLHQEGNLARMQIKSQHGGEIEWSIRFTD